MNGGHTNNMFQPGCSGNSIGTALESDVNSVVLALFIHFSVPPRESVNGFLFLCQFKSFSWGFFNECE